MYQQLILVRYEGIFKTANFLDYLLHFIIWVYGYEILHLQMGGKTGFFLGGARGTYKNIEYISLINDYELYG